ncbi:hypothetical protein MTO96_034489 [Rhipicephalus appendiculatus]
MERLRNMRAARRRYSTKVISEVDNLLASNEFDLAGLRSILQRLEKSADELAKANEALHAEMTDDEVLADMDWVLEYEDRAARSVGLLRHHIEELAVRNTGRSRSNVISFYVQDLLVGLVFAWALLFPLAAVTVTVEAWLLARPWGGPLCAALLLLAYPAPPRWTPARGDTCLVVTTVAGIWAGEALLPTLLGAATPTPVNPGAGALYAVEYPTLVGLAFIVARTVVGLLASVLVRTAVKAVIYPLLCSLHGCDPRLETSRQKGSIELPYKYITYLSMGITMSLVCPWLFHQLGIQRDSLPVHL